MDKFFSFRYYIKVLIFIFAPIVIIVSGSSLAYYLFAEEYSIDSLKQQDKLRSKLQSTVFRDEFQSIVSDLIVLSEHHQVHMIAEGGEAADYAILAKEFLAFCQNKKKYDQVRFLDETGMETVRVNFNQGHPVIVPADQLQSKAGRYYFEDTLSLKKGEVFVSPLDLNIEGGAIENPIKPMIRFGLPVISASGKKRGVVILNYFGQKLIDQLENTIRTSNTDRFGILLNRDGYFLKGIRDEDEWGFMLPGREKKTFSNLFPAEWNEVSSNLSGQIFDPQGLFTFSTVYPLTEGLKSSSGSTDAFGSSIKSLKADQYFWKIFSFTPREAIWGMMSQLRGVLLIFNGVFVLFAGVGSWLLARAVVKRQASEAEINYMAHFDLLTGLPNRATLYDRVSMALAAARRENTNVSLFFIDLDGFKFVNDTFGHEAGDQVLIEAAKRLQQCLRETDTVARLGGDEFVLVLTSATDEETLGAIATKVTKSLSEPIMFKDQTCTIGASIGIAVFPKDGENMDTLLSKADAAMYAAKKGGKNTHRFCL
jgi:diguanylate cyclase